MSIKLWAVKYTHTPRRPNWLLSVNSHYKIIWICPPNTVMQGKMLETINTVSQSLPKIEHQYFAGKQISEIFASLRNYPKILPSHEVLLLHFHRNAHQQTIFVELWEDERLSNVEELFKVTIFYRSCRQQATQVPRHARGEHGCSGFYAHKSF